MARGFQKYVNAVVVNTVAVGVFVVVATSVIFDIFVVTQGVVIDTIVISDVVHVVNCPTFPCTLRVATAAFRRSNEAATPTEQR